MAPFEMDFKETQSSVDGKQANYDNEVVVFEVGHLQSVFPTFAPTILLPQQISCGAQRSKRKFVPACFLKFAMVF